MHDILTVGEAHPGAFHQRPQSARGRRAGPGNAPIYTQRTEYYGEEQNHGTGLLGDAPHYSEEPQTYQEEQWPAANRRKPLLGDTPQYDETQGYQEGYTEAWPATDRKPLLGTETQHEESQGYYGDQHARAFPASDKRKKPLLGEAPQYNEMQGHYGEESTETWPPTVQEKPSLLGEAPQGYQQEAFNEQWPQESQEYQEGYGDNWPQADTKEGYSDVWPQAGIKKKSLLGVGPQYETENVQDAQYTDTWPVSDSTKGILGDAPPNEYREDHYAHSRPGNKRGLLGEAPGYGEEAQPTEAKRKRPLLGEEYREGQYAENRQGLLGDAPASAFGEGTNEYQEQYADTWPQSEKSTGLLGDAPPQAGEGQPFAENPYSEPKPQPGGKKGLLGDAPGYEKEAHTG